MKTRTKIVLTILAAVAYFLIVQKYGVPAKADLPAHLDTWYQGYNSEYFDDKLPRDIVIDWSEHDEEKMASTMKMSTGQFHIAFNEKYCLASRMARMILLHEMCHVKTWEEQALDDHGPRWRTCMLNLYQEGAFKESLIDGYRGD